MNRSKNALHKLYVYGTLHFLLLLCSSWTVRCFGSWAKCVQNRIRWSERRSSNTLSKLPVSLLSLSSFTSILPITTCWSRLLDGSKQPWFPKDHRTLIVIIEQKLIMIGSRSNLFLKQDVTIMQGRMLWYRFLPIRLIPCVSDCYCLSYVLCRVLSNGEELQLVLCHSEWSRSRIRLPPSTHLGQAVDKVYQVVWGLYS